MRCARLAAARATATDRWLWAIGLIAAIAASGCNRAAPDPAQARTASAADVAADRPASIPSTWTRFSGWSPECPLWLPPSADVPAPIRWEPCAADLGSLSCRQLVVD